MNRSLTFEPEPFETYSEFAGELSEHDGTVGDREWEAEVRRARGGVRRSSRSPSRPRPTRSYPKTRLPRARFPARGQPLMTGARGLPQKRFPVSRFPDKVPVGAPPKKPPVRFPLGTFPVFPFATPPGPPEERDRFPPSGGGGGGAPPEPPPREEPAAQGSEHVRWVQHCLNQVSGLRLPVTGIMNPETRSAIRSFQQQRGLPVDGIVGPPTESALITACGGTPASDTEPGAEETELGTELLSPEREQAWEAEVNRGSPDYIRWVQTSLNRILNTRLAVDGVVGQQTRSAIRSFQQRQGLKVDGIVGSHTQAALIAAGAPPPPSGTTAPPPVTRRAHPSINTPLPRSGPGFYSYKPTSQQYGLPETIQALQAIGSAWQKAHPQGPRIGIGDISLRGGGPMRGHKSHQKGVDVDVRLVRNDRREEPTRYQSPQYSRALTQELINRIRANGILGVRFILFNDPRATGVKPWPNHDDHLHVRFIAPGTPSKSAPTPAPATTSPTWVLLPDVRATGDAQTVRYDSPPAWVNGANCTSYTAGAAELKRHIEVTFPGVDAIGGYACRANSGNPSETSVHGVGRALDIMIRPVGGAANSAVGDPIANWLVRNSEAIGVQYIIWNRMRWSGSRSPRVAAYVGPNPHIDHIHVELNLDGARRATPWFNR